MHLTWFFQVHFHPLHFCLLTPDMQSQNAKIQVQNNTSLSNDVVVFLVHQQVWQAHLNVDCPERWHQTDWVSAVDITDECQGWNSSQDTQQDLRHNSAETGVWNGLRHTTGDPQVHRYNRYTRTSMQNCLSALMAHGKQGRGFFPVNYHPVNFCVLT